jgi:hypothetical protein
MGKPAWNGNPAVHLFDVIDFSVASGRQMTQKSASF